MRNFASINDLSQRTCIGVLVQGRHITDLCDFFRRYIVFGDRIHGYHARQYDCDLASTNYLGV